MSKILSLDLGTTLGWAYCEDQVICSWGVKYFGTKGDDPHAQGDRLLHFYNWLNKFSGVDEVFFEEAGAYFRNMSANACYYEMMGVLKMFCAGNRIPKKGLHPSTLKMMFTGHGHAKKQDMCRTAHALGWKGGRDASAMDHDAADACALIVCISKERGDAIRFK